MIKWATKVTSKVQWSIIQNFFLFHAQWRENGI